VSGRSNVTKLPLRACYRCGAKFPEAKSMCPRCKAINLPQQSNQDDSVLLSEVSDQDFRRIQIGMPSIDKVFGGGIVTTSVTLLGGNPGAGKSTLSVQLADIIAGLSITEKLGKTSGREVVYVATEETAPQIKNRAQRLDLNYLTKIRILPMGSRADLGDVLMHYKPCAIFVDSMAGLVADPDAAVETTKRFKEYAEALDAPVILVDHVTKSDDFAGLMSKQHAPDTLLTLYAPDASSEVRELTPLKNRFGLANFQVYLMMTAGGLMEIEEEEDEEDE